MERMKPVSEFRERLDSILAPVEQKQAWLREVLDQMEDNRAQGKETSSRLRQLALAIRSLHATYEEQRELLFKAYMRCKDFKAIRTATERLLMALITNEIEAKLRPFESQLLSEERQVVFKLHNLSSFAPFPTWEGQSDRQSPRTSILTDKARAMVHPLPR